MSVTGDTTISVNFLLNETYDASQQSAKIHNDVTALRISLVYSKAADDKAGIPGHDDNIQFNPINVANKNVYCRNPSAAINTKKYMFHGGPLTEELTHEESTQTGM